MPYAVIANDIKEAKASAELLGEGRCLGYINEVLQPTADKTGALSSELAPGLVSVRYALVLRLPLKQTLVDTYGAYLAANKVEKPDIWAARDVALEPGRPYTPVVLAVWDSGVDTAIFKSQVVRDAKGAPVLIGFDKYANPTNTELQVLTPAMQARLPTMKARSKGFSDLQSNVDSPEANEVKQLISTLPREQYKPTIEELSLAGNYTHGTHVAGIAMEGNPYARLLVARMEFGNTLIPDPCPSLEQTRKDAKSYVETVEFLKRNKARVVNMSWGGSVNAIENDLELCGIGKTQEERKKLAREYFDIGKQALEKAFASAPEILFITAAGNSNQNASVRRGRARRHRAAEPADRRRGRQGRRRGLVHQLWSDGEGARQRLPGRELPAGRRSRGVLRHLDGVAAGGQPRRQDPRHQPGADATAGHRDHRLDRRQDCRRPTHVGQPEEGARGGAAEEGVTGQESQLPAMKIEKCQRCAAGFRRPLNGADRGTSEHCTLTCVRAGRASQPGAARELTPALSATCVAAWRSAAARNGHRHCRSSGPTWRRSRWPSASLCLRLLVDAATAAVGMPSAARVGWR